MWRFIRLSLLLLLLTACTGGVAAGSDGGEAFLITADAGPSATPFQPMRFTPSPIPSQTPTLTPSPTITPLPSATLGWKYVEPGQAVVPILLYHQVTGEVSNSRYIVSEPDFKAQMRALHQWGYTAIPISRLLDALTEGAELPTKPIVITFDDGYLSVYENAFPIMQMYGYPGVFYIIARNLESGSNVVHTPELQEMVAAGWEIGSHSYTHEDLTLNYGIASYEVIQSKRAIQQALGVEVQTFAYPYGMMDGYVQRVVRNADYRGGMGLGTSWTHTSGDLYYLNRIEIHGDFSVSDLAARLPWGEE